MGRKDGKDEYKLKPAQQQTQANHQDDGREPDRERDDGFQVVQNKRQRSSTAGTFNIVTISDKPATITQEKNRKLITR